MVLPASAIIKAAKFSEHRYWVVLSASAIPGPPKKINYAHEYYASAIPEYFAFQWPRKTLSFRWIFIFCLAPVFPKLLQPCTCEIFLKTCSTDDQMAILIIILQNNNRTQINKDDFFGSYDNKQRFVYFGFCIHTVSDFIHYCIIKPQIESMHSNFVRRRIHSTFLDILRSKFIKVRKPLALTNQEYHEVCSGCKCTRWPVDSYLKILNVKSAAPDACWDAARSDKLCAATYFGQSGENSTCWCTKTSCTFVQRPNQPSWKVFRVGTCQPWCRNNSDFWTAKCKFLKGCSGCFECSIGKKKNLQLQFYITPCRIVVLLSYIV